MILQPVLHHSFQPSFLSLLINKVTWGVTKSSLKWRCTTASAPSVPTPAMLPYKMLVLLRQYFFCQVCLLLIPLSSSKCSQIVWLLFPEFQQELEADWSVTPVWSQDTELSSRISPSLHKSSKWAISSSELVWALHVLLKPTVLTTALLDTLSCFFSLQDSDLTPLARASIMVNCCSTGSFKREATETFVCLKFLFALHWMVILCFSLFSHFLACYSCYFDTSCIHLMIWPLWFYHCALLYFYTYSCQSTRWFLTPGIHPLH